MSKTSLRLSAWTGVIASSLLFVGFIVLMRVFPPPSPTLSEADFAGFFRGHRTYILVGSVLEMCASAIVLPFGAVIAMFMLRIENNRPVWTYTMLMACCMGYTIAFIGGLLFAVTAYRPDFSNQTIYLMATLSFMFMVCPAVMGTVQYGATGICILGDKTPDPLLPRWLGYLNLWVAVLFLPGQLVVLFMGGPFAWNGILGFWVPAAAYGMWMGAMTWRLLVAINRLPIDDTKAAPDRAFDV